MLGCEWEGVTLQKLRKFKGTTIFSFGVSDFAGSGFGRIKEELET